MQSDQGNGEQKLADDLLEGAEAAADWTGLKVRTIYHMVRNDQIPHRKAGKKLLFRKSELNRFFSAQAA